MIKKEMPDRICLWRDLQSGHAFPDDTLVSEVGSGLLLPEHEILEAEYVRSDIAESKVPVIRAGCYVDVTGLSEAAYVAAIAALLAAGCSMSTTRERPCSMKVKEHLTYLTWIKADSGSDIVDVVFKSKALSNAINAADLIKALPQLIKDETKNG